MTQEEEKAKAYDRAFKEAEKIHNFSSNIAEVKRMEQIFTELKESEDEKVRKELKHYLEVRRCQTNDDEEYIGCNRFLAWLEKQEGCEHIRKDWLEHIKQSWYKEGFIDGKYSGGTSKEWTINDAATLKEIIDFFENGTVKLQHDLSLYASWLKSIRPQNTWEPSDGQIMALRWVLNHIPYDSHKEEISGLLEQLKKLKEE